MPLLASAVLNVSTWASECSSTQTSGASRKIEFPRQSDEIEQRFQNQIRDMSSQSTFIDREIKYSHMRDKLRLLTQLKPGWDSYDAEAPATHAISKAEHVLSGLQSMAAMPTGVSPSAEGGVGFYFLEGQRYAHIEILNNGTWHALMFAPDRDSEAWQIEFDQDLATTWDRIRGYLQS